MIVFAMTLACLMCAGLIGALVLLLARAEKERATLVRLLASRTPHEYAVLTRADEGPAMKPAEAPEPAYVVGLS